MEIFTKSHGIGGRMRQRISDFIVEEIPPENASHQIMEQKLKEKKFGSAGKHTIFWMEKFNWDTHQALHEIARKLHVSPSRFGIAGTKDKRAVTKQRVSIWEISSEQLEKVKIRDIKLYGFEPSDKKIQLGESGGNKFEIIIRDIELGKEETEKRLKETLSQLQNGIPNLFGPQRFGEVRKITHLVGAEILKGNFEEAVKIYLAKAFDAEPNDSKEARNFLFTNWNQKGFAEAIGKFPQRLKYEVALCNYLSQNPKDFIGVFKIFPKKLQKMFVNAVQAWIWNEAVKGIWNSDFRENVKIPIVGCETKIKNDTIGKIITEIIKRQGIKAGDFKIDKIPDISSTGGERDFLLFPRGLEISEISDDDFNDGKKKIKIKFSLPPGSYATVVLNEIMK